MWYQHSVWKYSCAISCELFVWKKCIRYVKALNHQEVWVKKRNGNVCVNYLFLLFFCARLHEQLCIKLTLTFSPTLSLCPPQTEKHIYNTYKCNTFARLMMSLLFKFPKAASLWENKKRWPPGNSSGMLTESHNTPLLKPIIRFIS